MINITFINLVIQSNSMTQDSVDDIEIYDPDREESVSEEERQKEIEALRDRIATDNLDLDADHVYSEMPEEKLADARHNAKRSCLKHDDLSKYRDFLVVEILDMHQFKL